MENNHLELEVNHPIEKITFDGFIFDVDKNEDIIAVVYGNSLNVYDSSTLKLLICIRFENTVFSVLIYQDWIICACSSTVYFLNKYDYECVKIHLTPTSLVIWTIKMKNEKIYFPTKTGEVIVYDVKKDFFITIKLPKKEFTSIDIYEETLFIACHKKLIIRDVNNLEEKKKEIQLYSIALSVAVNSENIFIGDNKCVHVFTHDFRKLKSIEFPEGKKCWCMNIVNNYLIYGGSEEECSSDVLIYDLMKDEKHIIPNPKGHDILCVKPFKNDNQIFMTFRKQIMVYNFNFSNLKLNFTIRIYSFVDIGFKFQ